MYYFDQVGLANWKACGTFIHGVQIFARAKPPQAKGRSRLTVFRVFEPSQAQLNLLKAENECNLASPHPFV